MVSQGGTASGEDEPPSVAQMVAAICDALERAAADRALIIASADRAAPFDIGVRLSHISRQLDLIEIQLAQLERELATAKLLTAGTRMREGRWAPAGNGAGKLS
jgi:hypothetical protein